MSRSDIQRARDVADAAEEIGSIVAQGRAEYDGAVVYRRAMERCLEIIGEAGKALTDEARAEMSAVPWMDVIRLRDRLSHHYHRIDPAQLWQIAADEIPPLLSSMRASGSSAAERSQLPSAHG